MNHSKFTIEQTDEQLLGTVAHINYHLSFEKSTQHLLTVRMEIANCLDEKIVVCNPVWIPGSYKVRDMNQHQGNVRCTDANGDLLSMRWLSKNKMEIDCTSTTVVNVHYVYFANDLGVRTSHINRNHAFIVPAACLMFVENRFEEIHHVYFYHNRKKWSNITTSLSPIKSSFDEDEPIVLGALSYHILADSPIEVGNHTKRTFDFNGAKHEVAVISNHEVDIDSLTTDIRRIVETEAHFWGELPYDRYVFMLLVAEGQRGGLEHLRSSVSATEPQMLANKSLYQGVLGLLCHEFFHTWNIKRIRPIEYGPFNYNEENYSSMLWLAEGATSYFDDLLLYRSGLMTKEEFIVVGIINNIRALEKVKGRFAMSVKDSSFLAWIKLYSLSPDANNRFPSYYLKGGLIFLLLDLHIFTASKGTKRVDDVMRELWTLYKTNPNVGIDERGFYEATHRATGIDCSEVLDQWLNSTNELPFNEYFSQLGYEWRELCDGDEVIGNRMESDYFVGFSLKDDKNCVKLAYVEDDSPAAKAGFGIDDVLLNINNIPVIDSNQVIDIIQHHTETPLQILAQCDGIEFVTELIPLPRLYKHLCRKVNATEDELRLFERWLDA